MSPATGTIDDVIEKLTAVIHECRRIESPIGYFAALYRRITIAVKQAIAARQFDDNERMERIDVTFASRYLDALEQYRSGAQPTMPWAIAFRAARYSSPLVFQHLLLGVNAHVNLDLGIAVAEVCPGTALAGVRNDFFRLNALLGGQVDTVRRELSEICFLLRWTALLGRPEDRLVSLAVDLGRDHAWGIAQRLAAASPAEQPAVIQQAEAEAARLANDIRSPGLLLGLLFRLIRLTERGTVARKIDFLVARGPAAH